MKCQAIMQRDLRTLGQRPRFKQRSVHKGVLLLVAFVLAGSALTVFLVSELPDTAPDQPEPTPVPQEAAESQAEGRTHRISIPLKIPPRPQTDTIPADNPENTSQARPWLNHTVQSGDTLSGIFSNVGISPRELQKILSLGGPTKLLAKITPGQTLQLRLSEADTLMELRHEINTFRALHIVNTEGEYRAQLVERNTERRIAHASATIDNSLFQAAQRAGLPDNLTMELASIFGWDIDFALNIRSGDEFTVVFEELYRKGEKIGNGAILAAEFINRGKVFRAVRFVDPDERISYYTPEGQSMRKTFLRTPVKFSRISSGFNLRRKHPVLNKTRAHRGVDYAAPTGTPIRATADGKIIYGGWKGGYGRTLIIQHGKGYSTLYGHMSRYAAGAKKGRQVRQGQEIGYIGQSGLATGPHLHYEFRVNGVHRNPLKVTFPKAKPIPARYKPSFREQIRPLLAQLKLFKRVMVASRR